MNEKMLVEVENVTLGFKNQITFFVTLLLISIISFYTERRFAKLNSTSFTHKKF